MRKRNWMAVAALLTVLAIVGVYWWKNLGKQALTEGMNRLAPSVTLAGLNIRDIDPDNIKTECAFRVSNPLPVGFQIDSLEFEVWADSAMLLKDSYQKTIILPKTDTQNLTIPVDLKSAMLKRVAERFDKENKDSADYSIRARFSLHVPVAGKRQFTADISKRLPAIRRIILQPGKIKMGKLSFKDAQIGMTLKVDNHNDFPIDINNGKYTMVIDKDLSLAGVLQHSVHIPARGTGEVSMNMDVKTAKVPKLGWKMLFRKKQTQYAMQFEGVLRSNLQMLDKTKLHMNAEGSLEDIKELAKTGK